MTNTGDETVLIHDAGRDCWLSFHEPVTVYVASAVDEVIPALEAVEREVAGGLWAVGFISYEAGPAFDSALEAHAPGTLPLLWFGLYRAQEIVTPDFANAPRPGDYDWQPAITEDDYRRSIERVKEYIGLGETYQVNYTYRLRAPFNEDAWPLFAAMMKAQRCDFGVYINTPDFTVCSASPELFLTLENGELISKPMKGTMPRGLWCQDDADKAEELTRSIKNRAENVMITDMVRNDLGRIADTGSVEVTWLFDVEQYPTVWQMTSTVRCTTSAGIGEIMRATFPPASITGAPKARTMQIIKELENTPRQVYCGAIGFIAPDQRAQFNVAIRTVLVDKQTRTAEYGVGGGIVWDSTVGSEFEECLTKTKVLTQVTPEFDLLETLLWTPEEGFYLLDRHMTRLLQSAQYFGWRLDTDAVRSALHQAVESGTEALRVRLTVSEDGGTQVVVKPLTPLPQPYRIALAKTPVDSTNRFLYHKTTHREVYERTLSERPGFSDVLLWNEHGQVTESCIANVIYEMDGEWYTPPLHCGLLPGIYRAHLLAQGQVRERELAVDELNACTHFRLINSVRRQWDVLLEGQ